MMTVTFVKDLGAMTRRKLMVMVQEIAGLGENVKVTVGSYNVQVTGVGRYDEKKIKVLKDYGFSKIEDYDFEDWR